ncbi:3-ketoacyl-CoA synthase 5-like [Amaranthus tricolor]|uniref:3-ketoacyl-CoA synthase 5-like n=1 Tax=Amaranthus tricolor TaxID=29722 RepID=UPI0025874575|nr:3-ketoacyl-CoA synthase 5-like [Amaranthus tricolor]
MGSISKVSHETFLDKQFTLQNFPNLPILENLKFLAILILGLVESFLIIQKYNLFYHIIPILWIISYTSLQFFLLSRPPKIFLVDFSCFKPPSHCRIPLSSFVEHVHMFDYFDQQSVDFMSKILGSSGQGPETYLPPSLHYIPPKSTYYNIIDEAKMVLFPIMEDLLIKTKLSPQEIDIIIVNCSVLCPSPSLSSLIVNKFNLRPDIKSFNITGMGCSASMIAMSLAQNLLLVHKECNAVILSTEIVSAGWYPGNEPSKLFMNCHFRMGSAAILLSNRKQVKNTSKYELKLISRVQRAFDDRAYKCAYREEDSNGLIGVTVSKDVPGVFAELLHDQLISLGSLMLPTYEKFKFVTSIIRKKYFVKSAKIYVPNFKTVVQQFCLPVTGKQVIRRIGKGLRLGEADMEPALATWHRFGNMSSSSFWYEMAYLESKERIKEGERVLLIGAGSGMKCTSVVLQCIRPIFGESEKGPWAGFIDKYPASAI